MRGSKKSRHENGVRSALRDGSRYWTMYLIQVLLPLNANDGQPLPREHFALVREELQKQFGGLTVYSRSPAEGLWQEDSSQTVRDNIVLFEVMTEALDRQWWKSYRSKLEERFQQEEIVVRAQDIERL
jgi:hypothetical protein